MNEDYDADYYDVELDDYDADITTCPANIDSPDLQNTGNWQPYDSALGSNLFHCGYEGYLENATPTPETPQQECFYGDRGELIDEEHEDAGCRGTANQYDGHGSFSDALMHTFFDEGGIWENGRDGVATSIDHHLEDLFGDQDVEEMQPMESDESESSSSKDNGSIFDNW